ncbi:MAG: endonuclease/exonuclease/phosphatase family protein, partial [Bacteroidota bacterium]
MNRNRNLFHFIIATFYAPVLALSLLGLTAPYISTSIFSWIQLIPNLFPILAVFHLLAIFLFIKKFKFLSLFAFLGLLGCSWVISMDWKMGSQQDALIQENQSLKILSYNVGTFDFKAENIDTSSELLKSLEPDVITLQEFRNHKLKDGSYAIDYMSRALDMPYHRFVHLPVHIHGAVIYSKYPIVDIDTLFMPRKEINSGILASIETPTIPTGVSILASIPLLIS